jgi:hypothetical protein
MGYALIWAEGLAAALFGLALAAAWAARGGAARRLWAAIVYLVYSAAAGLLVTATFRLYSRGGPPVRTTWFPYSLTWLAAFVALGAFLLWRGLRRGEPGLAPPAAAWPRRRLWLGFGGAALALGLTFWNMDLAARADLAIARQEAGAFLLSLSAPPVPESENAARVYAEVSKDLGKPVPHPWHDAARRGLDAAEPVDWTAPSFAGLVKKHEASLARLRQAAAMRCSFDYQRGPVDVVLYERGGPRLPGAGLTLLAVDARVKAAEGNLTRAFENVSAILGIVRHISEVGFFTGQEVIAWRTLEDVLRLAPAGKGPLPPLAVPEPIPLVRKVREEQALLGVVLPAAASQTSLVLEDERRRQGPWRALLLEAAVTPTRVFLIPDDLMVMRKLFEEYQRSPRSARDETPKDWADLRKSVETDPTSIYGAIYVKPKHQVLLAEGSALAVLRQTARTGLAAARYHRHHGRFPERLEQLVPAFLPAVPVDPRDGQPLRLGRMGEGIILYAPEDAAAVEGGQLKDPEARRPPPVFRLYPPGP